MRALIFELHPTLLDTHGLVGAVREQAAWISRRGGPEVTVDGPDERLEHRARRRARRLPAGAGGAAQLREARAGGTRPRADRSGRRQPADAAPRGRRRRCRLRSREVAAPGLGLVSMRERAERLGGRLVVAPRPTGGTVVRLLAPRVLGGHRMTAEAIRVFVVDDHEVVRLGLRAFLGATPGVEVVGEAADGRVRAGGSRRARGAGRVAGRGADGPGHARARRDHDDGG